MLSNGGVLLVGMLAILTAAASIGEKRTILTSGDKVHTIYYQLGQSTVLYFGMKPETVICGNNNYFHIDKIKEGLTIQPSSNFSTNLTVLSQGKRYLFYLTPAKGGKPDSFVDVRWVPEQDAKPAVSASTKQTVHELTGRLVLGSLELNLAQEIVIDNVGRTILEFSVKNTGKDIVQTAGIELLAVKAKRTLLHQVSVFEQDEIKPNASLTGRLIVNGENLKGSVLVMKYQGRSAKVQGVAY